MLSEQKSDLFCRNIVAKLQAGKDMPFRKSGVRMLFHLLH